MNGLRPAIDFLTRTSRFIITAHETPDADAVGSECAMLRALRALGKEAIILNADPTPRKFTFIDTDGIIGVLDREDQLPPDVAQFSLLVLDTNDLNNIGQVARLVLPRVREHFIIDHHEQDRDIQAGNLINYSANNHQGSQKVYPTVLRNGSFQLITDWNMLRDASVGGRLDEYPGLASARTMP